MAEREQEGERIFRGIPVSAGIAPARILVISKRDSHVPQRTINPEEAPHEIARLEQALMDTRDELLAVQQKVTEGLGAADASIFDAHLLVLEDRTLLDEVMRLIEQKQVNVEYAFHQVSEKYATTLSALDDDYLRERAADMRDVTSRVLENLIGTNTKIDLQNLQEPVILISHDLAPSDTAMIDRRMVLGFGTDVGSRTSHTAIMARSMQIPAVVGLKDASTLIKSGSYALIDGYNGQIIINPTDATLFEYGQLMRNQKDLQEKLKDIRDKPATTLDGFKIKLSANVEQASDAVAVKTYGAEGVGLFRTEFLFINRNTLPSEEEQYQAYRQIAAALSPAPVVIRTLDLGGDKVCSQIQITQEMNPFLGWRAIRFCLEETEIFRSQLKAILRASAQGNVKIMYPMISCLDELNKANGLLEDCKMELLSRGIPFDKNLEIGIMVEIPSVAVAADTFAKRSAFFSIGTNDLIQYTLAVDRLNEKIAHLYEPTHPAIVRLIKNTVEAAHKEGIEVSVCGEMAGDPVLAPLLLGLGVDELSAAPSVVPGIKYIIRRLKMSEAKELAEFAMTCDSGREILQKSRALARGIAPSLFENEL
jgi:phosphotransferase system enzyme I (PtsI)